MIDVFVWFGSAWCPARSYSSTPAFGETSTGKRIAVVWEQALDNPLVIRPVTAYELD